MADETGLNLDTDPGLHRLLGLLRREIGWSQRQLAMAAGVSPSSVNRIESGERVPSMGLVQQLADAFGLPVSYLRDLASLLAAPEDKAAEEKVLEVVRSFRHRSAPTTPFSAGGTATTSPSDAPIFEASAVTPADRHELAATIPDGELRWVFRRSVGRDERGYWIDPAARANRGGLDAEDVRIERFDDGTFVIDVSRLQHEIGPRDPERHVALATEPGAPEPTLHDAYAATVLEMTLPDGKGVVLEPAGDDTADGDFPADVSDVHVITAFNPRSRLLTPGENTERNRLLERDLQRLGCQFTGAVGRSSDGSWSEESFAVFDADEADVVGLARQYEQNAIFRWTAMHRAVVYVNGRPDLVHGWRAMPVGPIDA